MMTNVTLNEKEIKIAIRYWLKADKNLDVKEDSGYLWQDCGDPPLSTKSIFARVELK